MQLEQDFVADCVATFDGEGRQTTLRSASRFGAWRARVQLVMAIALGRRAMNALHDANPMKVLVRSIIDRFDDTTRSLPDRGVMPLDEKAPWVTATEALWLVVGLVAVAWLGVTVEGVHPVVQLIRDLT